MQDGPARIAFDLGREFSEINGGFRKRDTVKKFIRRGRIGTSMIVEIPPELSKAVREKGISSDHIRFIVLRSLLQYLKS